MTSSSTTELELTFTSDVPFCSFGLSIKISPFGKCETASVKLIWIYKTGSDTGSDNKSQNPFLDFRNPNSFIWSFSKEITFLQNFKIEYSRIFKKQIAIRIQCNKISWPEFSRNFRSIRAVAIAFEVEIFKSSLWFLRFYGQIVQFFLLSGFSSLGVR